jgi:predicted nucleotidyltransferase component of viral defense system
MTNTIDLQKWVEVSEEISISDGEFRKAVKSILEGISQEGTLASLMVMKGGLLLAIKYQSPRFTKDIDFSTHKTLLEINIEEFLQSFEAGLATAEENEYGLAFVLQKHEIRPAPKNNPSYPTLHLKIGYANRNDRNQYNRLAQKQSAKVVEIDFSFNEWIPEGDSEIAILAGEGELKHYSLHEIVAEKFRSLLQQPIRERARYQDVYDLHLLLTSNQNLATEDDRHLVLKLLKEACYSRQVRADDSSFRNPQIKELARLGYEKELPAQLKEDPPEFEEAFALVDRYYSSLPW